MLRAFARRGPVRLQRAGTRQNTESLADWTTKTDIDNDQAVKNPRPGPLNCPFSETTSGDALHDNHFWAHDGVAAIAPVIVPTPVVNMPAQSTCERKERPLAAPRCERIALPHHFSDQQVLAFHFASSLHLPLKNSAK